MNKVTITATVTPGQFEKFNMAFFRFLRELKHQPQYLRYLDLTEKDLTDLEKMKEQFLQSFLNN